MLLAYKTGKLKPGKGYTNIQIKIYKNIKYQGTYELRFLNRLKEQFNISELNAETLYNPSFLRNLSKIWKDEYLSINKINTILSHMKPTGSIIELKNQALIILISEIGQDNVLSLFTEWQKKDGITKKQAYDLRRQIKQLGTIIIDNEENELIMELDNKIKLAARFN